MACGVNISQGLFLFEPQSEKGIEVLDFANQVHGVTSSADGRTIAAMADSGLIQLWDVEQKRLKHDWTFSLNNKGYYDHVSLSSRGHQMAVSTGDEVLLIDTDSGQIVKKFDTPDCDLVRFAPNAPLLLFESSDDFGLINLESSHRMGPFVGHMGRISDCGFSPTQPLIASASSDRTIRLWDQDTAEQLAVMEGHNDVIHRIWFSRDGNTLISFGTTSIGFWDVRTCQSYFQHVPQTEMGGRTRKVYSCAVSPDEQWLMVSGDNIGNMLYDLTIP